MNARFLKELALYGFSTLILRGASFFLMPLYLRLLPKEAYGAYELAMSVGTILSIISTFGFANYFHLHYLHLKTNMNIGTILQNYHSSFAIWCSIINLTYFTFVMVNWVNIPIPLEFKLLLIPIAILGFYQEIFFTHLRLSRKVKQFTAYQIGIGLATLIINVLGIIVLRKGIFVMFLSQLFGLAVTLVPSIRLAYNLRILSFKSLKLREWKAMMVACGFFVMSQVALFMQSQFDRIIIAKYCTLGDLGFYSVSSRIAMVFNSVVVATILNAYAPALLNKYQRVGELETERKHGQHILLIMVGGISMIFVIYIFGKGIYTMYVGENYSGSFTTMCLLMLCQVFVMGASLNSQLFVHRKELTKLTIGTWVASCYGVLSNCLLVPKVGITGAAISAVGANFIYFAYYSVLRYLRMRSLRLELGLKELVS